MIIEKRIKLRRLFPIIWKRLVGMTILSSAIVTIILWQDWRNFAPDITTPLILGTALAIFLGFRTDSANARWFSARSQFDALAAQARALGLVVSHAFSRHDRTDTPTLSKSDRQAMEEIVRLSVAHVWALGQQLKGNLPLEKGQVTSLLGPEILKTLSSVHNPALSIVFHQTQSLGRLSDSGAISESEAEEIADILRQTARLQTEAEGLKETPFPVHYSYFTHVFIWLLVVLLSLSLPAKEQFAFYAVPMAVLIGWVFFMIEGIGRYMEEPWENNRNVVPTDAIATDLERDIRSLVLKESSIPERARGEDGALY